MDVDKCCDPRRDALLDSGADWRWPSPPAGVAGEQRLRFEALSQRIDLRLSDAGRFCK